MDLVDKKKVALREIIKDSRHLTGLCYRGAARNLDIHAHFICDYSGKRGLSESGRAVKQHMIQRLASLLSRFYVDRKVVLGLFLTDVFA